MPPPMSPQGSRAGLITAVVILSILFVTSAIFAFYYNAEYQKALQERNNLQATSATYASPDVQQDPAFLDIMALRDTEPYRNQSAAQILLAQRNSTNEKLAGKVNPADVEQAYARAMAAATADTVKEAGVTTIQPGANLASVVETLAAAVTDKEAERRSMSEQLAAAQKQFQDEAEQRKVVLAERDAKIAELGQQVEAALAEIATHEKAGDESVETVKQEAARAAKVAQATLSKQQETIAAKNKEIGVLQTDLKVALQKIAQMRPVGTKENVVRQDDANVVRVPNSDTVYIDIGQGDQVAPGLTFEVYDRISGVPAVGPDGATDELNLPQGKASIEVVRAGANQSECRVIRITEGKSIIEGDIVANLVYDKKVRYNFVVFGEFDLDQNRIPTPGDAEVIKRLITGWGGRVQNTVNVNTDFVVLGSEPEVPVLDENPTATDVQRHNEQQKKLDAYLDVRGEAVRLNIPIMNQNRFLYYVGYYEQSQR